jgi:hypothetical protein
MNEEKTEEVQIARFEATANLIISQSPELELEHDKVVACLQEGIDFSPRRLGQLKQVKQANGNPNLILDEWRKKSKEQSKKKVSSFEYLVKRVIEVIDIFQRTPDLFERKERETLDILVTKISELTNKTQIKS